MSEKKSNVEDFIFDTLIIIFIFFVGILNHDDQLYIYEAISLLVIAGNSEPKEKAALMRNILMPLLTKVTTLAQRLSAETNSLKQVSYFVFTYYNGIVTLCKGDLLTVGYCQDDCACSGRYSEDIQSIFQSQFHEKL